MGLATLSARSLAGTSAAVEILLMQAEVRHHADLCNKVMVRPVMALAPKVADYLSAKCEGPPCGDPVDINSD